MADITKMEWVVNGGSIETKPIIKKKFEFSGIVKELPLYVAFNVGSDVARHMVKLHNDELVREI